LDHAPVIGLVSEVFKNHNASGRITNAGMQYHPGLWLSIETPEFFQNSVQDMESQVLIGRNVQT